MSLRKQALMMTALSVAVLIVSLNLILWLILLRGLAVLDDQYVRHRAGHILSEIDESLDDLGVAAIDWAAWDDSYVFVENVNEEYIRANLVNETFKNYQLNLILFLNTQGQVVWGKAFDLQAGRPMDVPTDLMGYLQPGGFLVRSDPGGAQGIVLLSDGPLLVAAQPILTSEKQGPARGTLIFASYLDEADIERLEQTTSLTFAMYRVDKPLSNNISDALRSLSVEQPIQINPLNGRTSAVHVLQTDIAGRPALVFQSEVEREIYQQGRAGLIYASLALIGLGLLFGAVAWWSMEKTVLARLTDLQNNVQRIGDSTDMSLRVPVSGQDELTDLACAINSTLESLQLSRQQVEKSAESLRQSRERYRSLVEYAPTGVMAFDMSGQVSEVNAKMLDILGFPSAQEADSAHLLSFPPLIESGVVGDARLCLESNQLISREKAFTSGWGRQAWVRYHIAPLRAHDGQVVGALVNVQDITDSKRAEQMARETQLKMEQARRVESLGTLAGGVAHDLNNTLGPLVGYSDMILQSVPTDNSLRPDVEQIKQAAERAAAMVQDLLTLARRGVYRLAPLNLNQVIQEYLRSPSFIELMSAHPHVSVRTDLADDLLHIAGSSPHLNKVVMNLVANAVEAMPYHGVLSISTLCQTVEEPLDGYERIEVGDYVVLRVCDTGTGIAPADLERIFEPFYTKKTMGRSGSGLGLSVVHGVVHDHGGRIDIHSQVGVGSEFVVYFPVCYDDSPVISKTQNNYRGDETILVLDDMEDQRELALRLLSLLGYRVQVAESGQAALEWVRRQPFDLLLLDMIMQDDMDGLETYRQVIQIRPGQKAVIASGYSETERVRQAQQLGAGAFVRKPYTIATLGQAIRQELDRSRGRA